MVEEILRVENLSKSFEGKKIIDNVTLSFYEGEIFTLMGQSGVGKSVFIRMINGLIIPDSGKIIYKGKDITNASEKEWIEIRKEIGMLFQNSALFDSMNVLENVSFQIKEHNPKIKENELKEKVKQLLLEVGLKDIEELFPSQLSGGMQKRVSLARTISMSPKIILYDEPITGLDPITSSIIIKLIKSLNRKMNITSIIVSHDVKSSTHISDRIGLLYKGQLVALERTENLSHTKNKFLKQFLTGAIKGPIETILEEK